MVCNWIKKCRERTLKMLNEERQEQVQLRSFYNCISENNKVLNYIRYDEIINYIQIMKVSKTKFHNREFLD